MNRKLSIVTFVILTSLLICCSKNQNPLPEYLYNFKRTDFLQGAEAEEFVNKLHLKTVVSVKSEIAVYQGEKEPLTIYITYYDNPDTALQEMQKMIDKMTSTETVFIKGENISINDQQVFRCFGMGQTHYIFAVDDKLFWVSVGTLIAADFMEYYLDRVN